MASTFKCQKCGNLHGARVEACGACGSMAVSLVNEDPPSAPSGLEGLASVSDERGAELVDAAIDFFRCLSAWVRQQGVDVPPTGPRTPRNTDDDRGEQPWPG